jgi:arginine:ornithine antiporter/lysine permease
VAILPPYVFSGAYALKLALTGETYEGDPGKRTRDIVIGALATIYGVWLCYAAKLQDLLLAALLFAPATAVYFLARRERGGRVFTPVEAGIAIGLAALALFAIYSLATGHGPLANHEP